jgi:hypothetical protein
LPVCAALYRVAQGEGVRAIIIPGIVVSALLLLRAVLAWLRGALEIPPFILTPGLIFTLRQRS